ncbi:MAG TPA: branched-chain amino acid transaminase [Thermoanaerobaculia bacterium]|nr:branched-chain amino acid transaminase [Thermoanaerobaculia bacterium]HLN92406.1 branched-chain amino acid transaminase [Thermoanaerobaculia bacterium]
MSYEEVQKVWMNGELVDFADAKIHAFSHVFHYGSAMFEGIRVYKTRNGPAAFRLEDHIERLYHSCKVYRMEIPYTHSQFQDAIFETIRVNGFDACYIRPVIYRGLGALGVNPFKSPVDVIIAVWKWGQYLGEDAVTKGVDVCVSSWNRMAPNTFPAMAKATGNYLNSMLIKMEAITNGYTEGIALDSAGRLSEGSGENLFLVYQGRILTPPLAGTILPGITRDTVITLAKDAGYIVVETQIAREMLYIADEVFLTGTAAEITPVRSVDRIPVGTGGRGPVTERLQKDFFALLEGEAEDRYGWLTPIPAEVAVSR